MTLGAEHEQTARFEHPRLFLGNFPLDALDFGVLGRAVFHLAKLILDTELDITAQLNVGPATGHVGGDGDCADAARLRNDMRFAFVLTGVENFVLHAFFVEELAKQL